jgi:type III pantothenate kinase
MSDVPLIAVDIGNSSTKIGWSFQTAAEDGLPAPQNVKSIATGQSPPESLAAMLPQERCRWHIVSVHREGTRVLTKWLQSHRGHDEVRVLTHRDLPIPTRVDFPDRVGLDRLAAAVAVNAIRSRSRAAIVVDAGSAVTVDLVAADGVFEGGVILPGFRMSAEALYGADLLPLAVWSPEEEPPAVVGKNTEAAIRSGLFWGAVGAVREIVERMSASLEAPPNVFVTGGDLRQLTQQLGDVATFVPHMVLSGIAISASQ